MRVADIAVNKTVAQQTQPGLPCEPACTATDTSGKCRQQPFWKTGVEEGEAGGCRGKNSLGFPRGTFTRLRIRMCFLASVITVPNYSEAQHRLGSAGFLGLPCIIREGKEGQSNTQLLKGSVLQRWR